jgi:hypothetical protein
MRLRIETRPPLPVLKTWLSVNPGFFGFGTRTFNDLCKRLVSEFGLPNGIKLQLKGFDLPGPDLIELLVEKDDLITYVLLRE